MRVANTFPANALRFAAVLPPSLGWILLTLCCGSALTVQVGANATLARTLGHPLWATLVSFATGLMALGAVLVATRPAWSTPTLTSLPWWAWSGGIIGAAYVTCATSAAPRLGSGTLTASVVGGQMVASLLLDHYGYVGFAVHRLSLGRFVGAALVIGGVILIERY